MGRRCWRHEPAIRGVVKVLSDIDSPIVFCHSTKPVIFSSFSKSRLSVKQLMTGSEELCIEADASVESFPYQGLEEFQRWRETGVSYSQVSCRHQSSHARRQWGASVGVRCHLSTAGSVTMDYDYLGKRKKCWDVMFMSFHSCFFHYRLPHANILVYHWAWKPTSQI